MSDVDQARIARLLDEDEIRAVIYRYCRGFDRKQEDVVLSCFHEGAVEHHGVYDGPVEGFVDMMRGRVSTSSLHFIGNILIDVQGDAARVESYLVAYHRFPADDDHPERDYIVGGRYVDDFGRRDGVWRIDTRVLVFDWGRMEPAAAQSQTWFGSFIPGRQDLDDPVFLASLHDAGRHASNQ